MLKSHADLEAQISKILISILKIDKIGMDDDFFDAGARSLHVILFLQQLQKTFGVSLRYDVLYDGATIRQVASKLRNMEYSEERSENYTRK